MWNLHCGHNYDDKTVDSGLARLDISGNTALHRLTCCCNVELSSLDVSDSPNLIYIQAHLNKIPHLDVSNLNFLPCFVIIIY